jgi:hypothetical protein
MPFTPFHVGPALLIYAVFPILDPVALVFGAVLVDLEGLFVVLFRLPFSLHGPFHSVVGVFLLLPVFLAATFLTRRLVPQIDSLLKARPKEYSVRLSVVSGLVGGFSHILLDAPLYSELNLAWPLPQFNLLLNLLSPTLIYNFCIIALIIAIVIIALKRKTST